jgi:hypothetical protein
MIKRYIIIDESRGIFLGSYSTPISANEPELSDDEYDVVDEYKLYALFASNNPFSVSCAPTFDSLKDANKYVTSYLSKPDLFDIKIVDVLTSNSNENYASIAEIIKAGYSDYTFDMMDSLLPESSLVH